MDIRCCEGEAVETSKTLTCTLVPSVIASYVLLFVTASDWLC